MDKIGSLAVAHLDQSGVCFIYLVIGFVVLTEKVTEYERVAENFS